MAENTDIDIKSLLKAAEQGDSDAQEALDDYYGIQDYKKEAFDWS